MTRLSPSYIKKKIKIYRTFRKLSRPFILFTFTLFLTFLFIFTPHRPFGRVFSHLRRLSPLCLQAKRRCLPSAPAPSSWPAWTNPCYRSRKSAAWSPPTISRPTRLAWIWAWWRPSGPSLPRA